MKEILFKKLTNAHKKRKEVERITFFFFFFLLFQCFSFVFLCRGFGSFTVSKTFHLAVTLDLLLIF